MLSVSPPPSLPLRHHHNRSLIHHRKHRLLFTIRSSSSSSIQEAVEEKTSNEKNLLSSELYSTTPFPSIKAAKRVILVRHGQSTWNEEGRIQGSSDFSVLTKKGEAQAETSRQMLIDDSFDVCFSSPLIRSKRTAEIIWGSRKVNMITDSDLREIDLYSFQGLLKHEGKARFGAAFRQWQVDAANFNIDGHFPVRELWGRARNCWNKILAHERLGTEYFRILLQSNCGVSVLDFAPRVDGGDGSPYICLNRLNQTPNSPVAAGSSAGRKTSKRIILVSHGTTQGGTEVNICSLIITILVCLFDGIFDPFNVFQATFSNSGNQPMSMLGIIQSQKTAELLLDLNVSTIVSSPKNACVEMATTISRVQEAADCLGADCVPRCVEMKQIKELDDATEVPPLQPGFLNRFEDEALSALWEQSGKAWQSLLNELSDESKPEKIVVAVGDPAIHIALMGHCLNLTADWMGSFHLDAGSISVLDFPDGPTGRGTIRCINYTAHLGRWSIPITRSTIDDEEF
ncbi:hypothetical protein POTOM_017929 [Populus tomentosa]|uniref:Phosphoglycerate/bisphosphoglycerate mutase family protein n=1 Tax=Populus tomentosa TaxID=118781 RepID=A0A8X8D739_POPTO|nr:hypothetical protein POTOM_017929 [Populus tomentosa]